MNCNVMWTNFRDFDLEIIKHEIKFLKNQIAFFLFQFWLLSKEDNKKEK